MLVRGQRVRNLRHQWNCHWLKNQSGKSEYLPRTPSCCLPAALSNEANLVRCRCAQFHYNLCVVHCLLNLEKLPCRTIVSTNACIFLKPFCFFQWKGVKAFSSLNTFPNHRRTSNLVPRRLKWLLSDTNQTQMLKTNLLGFSFFPHWGGNCENPRSKSLGNFEGSTVFPGLLGTPEVSQLNGFQMWRFLIDLLCTHKDAKCPHGQQGFLLLPWGFERVIFRASCPSTWSARTAPFDSFLIILTKYPKELF